MSRVRRNLVANFIANAWVPLMALAGTPFYIKALGMEAFGLIGVFMALQALARPLDAGLSMTLSRELARLSVEPDPARAMRDLLRTLARVYWGIAMALTVVVCAAAPAVARWWVQAEHLSDAAVIQTLCLMGLALGLQWPSLLYQGGLIGLQHQVSLGAINTAMATVRFLGVLPMLWWVSPTIQCFFLYQAGALAAQTVLLMLWLWRTMPRAEGPTAFRVEALRRVWRFAAGVGGAAVAMLLLTQLDKVILTKMVPLGTFGYYAVPSMAAAGLACLYTPVFQAFQPRLTQLASLGRTDDLADLYHHASQIVSVVLLPATGVLAVFSAQVLGLWIQQEDVVAHGSRVLTFLSIGMCLYGLLMVPYALQLACGWTRLTFIAYGLAVAVLVPAMILATRYFGPVGTAAAWLAPGAGLLLGVVPVMHRRLLPGQMWRWYGQDLLAPTAATAAVAAAGRWLWPTGAPAGVRLACLAGIAAAMLLAAAMAAPTTRKAIVRLLPRA